MHYRGYVTGGVQDFMYRTPREDRRPRDSSPEKSKMADEAMHRVFGWYPRSQALFISPHPWTARNYAGTNRWLNVYMVFPPKGFKCVWSPTVFDMMTSGIMSYINTDLMERHIRNVYKDTGYEDNDTNELMIYAKDILLVNIVYYPFVYERWGDAGYNKKFMGDDMNNAINDIQQASR
jgi:hypothetical protein